MWGGARNISSCATSEVTGDANRFRGSSGNATMARNYQAVLTLSEPDASDDGRRFLAVLFFIAFFPRFIGAGESVVSLLREGDNPVGALWVTAIGLSLATAILLYIVGRQFWYGR